MREPENEVYYSWALLPIYLAEIQCQSRHDTADWKPAAREYWRKYSARSYFTLW